MEVGELQPRPTKMGIYIAERLAESIRRGEFTFGESLPPERNLAEMFGVNRQAIREALTALQMAGLVLTRAGLGTFVGKPVDDIRSRVWSMGTEESVGEVLEARILLEPEGAALAARRVGDEGRERLTALVGQLRESIGDVRRFGALDLQFHREVAEASGNRIIARVVTAFAAYGSRRVFRDVRARSYSRHPDLSQVYLGHHEQTLEAILRGRPAAARRSMHKHLKLSETIWFADEGPPQPSPSAPRLVARHAKASVE